MQARGTRGQHWISHRLMEISRLLSSCLNAVRIRMFVTATGGAQEKKHWRAARDTAGSQSYCRSIVLVKRSPWKKYGATPTGSGPFIYLTFDSYSKLTPMLF